MDHTRILLHRISSRLLHWLGKKAGDWNLRENFLALRILDYTLIVHRIFFLEYYDWLLEIRLGLAFFVYTGAGTKLLSWLGQPLGVLGDSVFLNTLLGLGFLILCSLRLTYTLLNYLLIHHREFFFLRDRILWMNLDELWAPGPAKPEPGPENSRPKNAKFGASGVRPEYLLDRNLFYVKGSFYLAILGLGIATAGLVLGHGALGYYKTRSLEQMRTNDLMESLESRKQDQVQQKLQQKKIKLKLAAQEQCHQQALEDREQAHRRAMEIEEKKRSWKWPWQKS